MEVESYRLDDIYDFRPKFRRILTLYCVMQVMFEDKCGLATLVLDQWLRDACVAKVSQALRWVSC